MTLGVSMCAPLWKALCLRLSVRKVCFFPFSFGGERNRKVLGNDRVKNKLKRRLGTIFMCLFRPYHQILLVTFWVPFSLSRENFGKSC
jgi:hypothetical protein